MQKSMLSTSFRMLAPVVVKPDTTSKNASTKDGIVPLKTKGRQPIRLNAAQESATITKPSLANMPRCLTWIRERGNPIPADARMASRKYRPLRSP